jgi:hypothetical protein
MTDLSLNPGQYREYQFLNELWASEQIRWKVCLE